MIQIRPSEPYTLVRILPDTLDNETNYVRVVIRRASDGVTLDTVNLNDLGNRVFTRVWQAPGQTQLQIILTSTVYSDSAYSTVNTNYYTQSDHAIIENRPGYWPQFGGGGASIDYKKLKQIIRETIDETPTKDFPEIPKTDLSGMILQLGRIEGILPKILKAFDDIPEQEKVNFSPVMQQFQEMKRLIQSLPFENIKQMIQDLPEPEKLDLSPILEELNIQTDKQGKLSGQSAMQMKQLIETVLNQFTKDLLVRMDEVEEIAREKMFTLSIPSTTREKKEPSKSPRFTI